ncbi:hypothetical protein B0H13DRAFT_2338080 [Mycena leptocephala]|nr:hypothetical protein B0H13DRAFT_2338080 [Mycena leptocephala]
MAEMLSSLDHHHQEGPATPLATTPHSTVDLCSRDELRAHHQHLETLLDSALATLALIRETTTALPYTPHLLAVLRVLNHHIAQSTAPTTGALFPANATPTPTATPMTTTTTTTQATYAAASDPRRSGPISTPEPNTVKQEPSEPFPPRAPRRPAVGKPTRVIIRFDQKPDQPQPFRASPFSLYKNITASLLSVFQGTGYAKLIAGVQWTRRGNLVLHPATEVCTAKFLAEQEDGIWAAIHPLLRLPETYSRPIFDTDEQWHSVVFHGVPVPPNRRMDPFTHKFIDDCVKSDDVLQGEVKGFSVLCRPEDLQTRSSLALRVSLSSEADALRLIKNGGFMAGTWCKVSHYVEKPRTRVPSPAP